MHLIATAWGAAVAVATIALAFFLRERGKRRGRRAQAAHVQILSESRCPHCSRVYGMHAALQAFYGDPLPGSIPFTEEWWREKDTRAVVHRPRYGPWRKVYCPDCGEGHFYDLCERALEPLRAPYIPKPYVLPASPWGEAVCNGCGARKRHWADHAHWRCARCHEPLGEAPTPPDQRLPPELR